MVKEAAIASINTQEIARKGNEIYQLKFKSKYESKENGKFLAIDIKSEEAFLGKDLIEAVASAKKKYPDRVFYIKKIGFSASETVSLYCSP